MPDVRPFRSTRYDLTRLGGTLTNVLAPPYDVLDEHDKSKLLAQSNRNIVEIDLPYVPPKTAGPPEVYEQAARSLRSWLTEGTLRRDTDPAVLWYLQDFQHAGRTYSRRMLIARLRLEPLTGGGILPHEQTFGGPKEDRLALMKAARCQMSPIFGLFSDPQREIATRFASAETAPPDAAGDLDGVRNRLWKITHHPVLQSVAQFFLHRKVYIADGHHRYGTALLYRDWLNTSRGGQLPMDHPAQFVMFVLAAMEDPGCLILPYHRAISRTTLDAVLRAWSPGVEKAEEVRADLRLVDGASRRTACLRFTHRPQLAALAPDESPAWHQLDVAYLHRYLIDELLTRAVKTAPIVHYLKSEESALDTAARESGVAVLLNPTPMGHLRAVSESGGLMPQKSTYFHPKLATGLALYFLDE